MEKDGPSDPFQIPDLWRPSLLTVGATQEGTLFPEIELDVTHIRLQNPYAQKSNLEHDLRLPHIDNFVYGPLDDIEPLEESEVSTEPDAFLENIEDEEKDVWFQVVEPRKLLAKNVFSWDAFSGAVTTTQSPYLSESGSGAFDAVVRAYSRQSAPPIPSIPVIKSNVFLASLLNLALGRSSSLFDWNDRTKTFKPVIETISSHGYTCMTVLSFCDKVMSYGSAINRLRKFSERTYASGDMPSRVALANAVSSVLSGVEAYLSKQFLDVKSLLQLQNAIEKPRQLLQEMMDLLKALRLAKTDEKLCSITFNRCLKIEHGADWLGKIMLQILSRVTRPLLDRIDSCVGFSSSSWKSVAEDSLDFMKVNETGTEDAGPAIYSVEGASLPDFLSRETAEQVCEIRQGLRLLERHHPHHILVEPQADQIPLSLDWNNQWSQIDSTLNKARKYESELAATVREYSAGRIVKQRSRKEDEAGGEHLRPVFSDDYETGILKSLDRFAQLPSDSFMLPDELLQLVLERIESQELDADITANQQHLEPPVALLPMLSFNPLLSSQARLVRGACLRALFRSHGLRNNLRVQKLFHLMGDGVFLSRISAALFDSTAATTERQLGVMRSGTGMGLKLSERQSWPPASSELRLALTGILNDCYYESTEHETSLGLNNSKKELPGGLSFAIRNLGEDEVERIMDPNSLHALDFLRLHYTPPSPIDMVITPASLEKYDLIFKFLLRIVRLLFVVSRLPIRYGSPMVLRFGMQARHFVNTCAQYFFDTAIGATWSGFEKYLDGVEAGLVREDEENPAMMRDISGIDDLRKRHDACLDKMLFSLLLRHRQQKMMALLEEICGTILRLEKLCRAQDVLEHEVAVLHDQFLQKALVFLEVCRGLVGKKGYEVGLGTDNTIEMLVTGLDYNDYYSSKKHG